MSTRPTQITLDLTRLEDPTYMEVMTGTPAWAALQRYFEDSMTVSFLEQVRSSDLPDETKSEVLQSLLRNLDPSTRERVSATLQVSDLLDTLIVNNKGSN